MKVHFLSFASLLFCTSLKRLQKEAEDSGFFDTVSCLKVSDLPLSYRIKNILQLNRFTRGFGFWMWKSYIVKRLLETIKDGDILVYADAGCTINKEGKNRFEEYLQMLCSSKQSNISFETSFPEIEYTKGDVFNFFGIQNMSGVKNSNQLMATIFLVKKDEQALKLIEEWYHICHNNKKLINDSLSSYPNDPAFIDHRHDQSIFSILRKLRGTISIPDETYFYDWQVNKKFPIHARRLRK